VLVLIEAEVLEVCDTVPLGVTATLEDDGLMEEEEREIPIGVL
jgi:hypothetical protein